MKYTRQHICNESVNAGVIDVINYNFIFLYNILHMKTRLQTLLSSEGIASSRFADVLGVNRSSISHLLSGRNNPSLDFLQKVLVKYPKINPDWLLLGQGEMYRNNAGKVEKQGGSDLFDMEITNKPKQMPQQSSKVVNKPIFNKVKEVSPQVAPEPVISNNVAPKDLVSLSSDKKKLRKIVFFYEDNTFETFDAD